jgi:hypothetical protein
MNSPKHSQKNHIFLGFYFSKELLPLVDERPKESYLLAAKNILLHNK